MRNHTSGLKRDLEVLELLASEHAWDSGGLGVKELAQMLNRDKGQISRVCRTLEQSGLVGRDLATKRYSLGHHIYTLAMRTREAHLANLSHAALLKLVAVSEESAHLTVLRGGSVLTVRTELAQHTMRDGRLSGVSLPALRTASGRAMLSTFSNEQLDSWWQEHGVPKPRPEGMPAPKLPDTIVMKRLRRTQGSIRSFGKLMKVIRVIRKTGYAISDGELTESIVDAAAPIYDPAGNAIGAIAVGARRERISDRYDALGELVREAANTVTGEWAEQ
jgi:DNA-binding IclR family transcriptional regulator